MDFLATLGLAIRNLRRNRLRTALSLLGVTIGVFSVTMIVSLGFGLQSYILGQVEQFGKNFITINATVPELSHQGSITSQITGGPVVSIDRNDMEELAELPHVTNVVGFQMDQAYLQYRNKEHQTMIIGTTANYPEFDVQTDIASGRFFTDREDRTLAQVMVIGPKVADKLFGREDPVGKSIKMKGMILEVVGVTESRGLMMGFDFDTLAFIPLTLMHKRLTGDEYVQEIDVIVSATEYVDEIAVEAARVLRREHRIEDEAKDDFMIHTFTEVVETIGTVTNALTILLGLLAAISLLVGGIGIMNIMLVSVTERIREVGLRKALGAKNGTIQNQFLYEAVVLTTIGGVMGGGLGTGITLAVIAYARYTGFDVQYLVSLPSLLAALAVAVVVGVVFGIYPARKAAKLDPITALKYE
ncbi:hypothetical protein AMJ57_05090 [Parcubacteria bacterium SG8_24]|nr:MAG: hypothetical protein AMJ57_05090 [Parcubacteria bacterium SG8_24]